MDFYADALARGAIVETPEDLERKKRSLLPRTRAVSVGGTVTNTVQPGEELGSGRKMLAQALKMYGAAPDTSALEGMAQDRVREGENSMLNALAAQFAGERFSPIQAQYLKRSMAAQEPMKVGNYGTIAGGKFVADPYTQRDTQADALLNVGGKLLDNEEADAREKRLARQFAASGGGGAPRFQQGSAFALPDGRVVQGMFDPQRGYVYNTPQGLQPIPAEARPATPSMGAPLNASGFNKAVTDLGDEMASLSKLTRYEETVGDANVGLQRWADQVAANAKTLFGSKSLTPEQLASLKGQAQLQSLLGLFRQDIVGPGAMTEYDAQRVLTALGGDFNKLQNPQFVREVLADIRAGKQRRIAELQRQVEYSSPYFQGVYQPGQGGANPPPAAPASGGSRKVVVDY
jgi:hypothetical protein